MSQPENVGEGIGLLAKLTIQLHDYERLTGYTPTRIKLGANQLRTYREEARLHTTVDVVRDDAFMGVRIVPASHPDDIIIDHAVE